MQKAIELNPNYAAALNYLGYTYAEMGVELDRAEALINRALELEPNDGFFIDSLGWVYYQKGDYPRAIEQLERAVHLVVDDPVIIEHLGDAYLKDGRPGKALTQLSRRVEGGHRGRAAGADPIEDRRARGERFERVAAGTNRCDGGGALCCRTAGGLRGPEAPRQSPFRVPIRVSRPSSVNATGRSSRCGAWPG